MRRETGNQIYLKYYLIFKFPLNPSSQLNTVFFKSSIKYISFISLSNAINSLTHMTSRIPQLPHSWLRIYVYNVQYQYVYFVQVYIDTHIVESIKTLMKIKKYNLQNRNDKRLSAHSHFLYLPNALFISHSWHSIINQTLFFFHFLLLLFYTDTFAF